MFQSFSSSSSSSLFLVAFELSKKKELCGNWNILEEVEGKKGKEGTKKESGSFGGSGREDGERRKKKKKKKEEKGTCVEEKK